MTSNSDIVFTPAARRAQAELGSAGAYDKRVAAGFPDRVTNELAAFITGLDTAFLATVSAAGAPYIQHRGGPKGFIKVLDDKTLGFADYAGNRQYITLSNLAENERAYLFLLDFAARRRIKVWGRAQVVEDDPALLARLADPGYRARPERAILHTAGSHRRARSGERSLAGISDRLAGSGPPAARITVTAGYLFPQRRRALIFEAKAAQA